MRLKEQTPNGENATLAELAVAMEAAPNKRSYIRLGAIRLLLKGPPRATVCDIYQRSDRMVRLWITDRLATTLRSFFADPPLVAAQCAFRK